MIPEEYKCVKAELKVLGEEDIIEEQGLNIFIDRDNVIFDQGIRTITYEKAIVKEMKIYVKNPRYNTV